MEDGSGAGVGNDGLLSRIALNDNKAGMEGLDRDKINKIILETSKGSRFYENELKKDQQVNQRIEKIILQKTEITESQMQKAQKEVEKLSAELESGRDLRRVIVHVDMDAFYAAVEMRDCPELKDKPMAVGSMSMLSTSNYHARRYGVRAAMPGFIAKKLCPNLVIVPLNFDKYRTVSQQVREIFADYDPHFLPMSLDEAYLDITEHLEQRQHWAESMRTHAIHDAVTGGDNNKASPEAEADTENLSPILFEDSPSASPPVPVPYGKVEVFGTTPEEAVREMRFRIEQKTSLTASAGIAPNMMLAKVCSDKNKPNGQYRIPPERAAVMEFIRDLPVRKVSGIGKVTEKMLAALDIVTCAQLGQQMVLLSLLFSGTSWHHFLQISLGLGSTHIERDSERKSMSTERTFGEMSDAGEQYTLCKELCQDLAQDLQRENLKGKTVTLKLKNVNFEVKTKAFTLPSAVCTEEEIFAAAKELLKAEIDHVSPQPLRLRLMGVRVSSFTSADDKKPQQRSIVGFLKIGSDSSGSKQTKVLSGPETESLSRIESPRKWSAETSSCSVVKDNSRPHSSKLGTEPGDSNCAFQLSFFQMAYSKRLQQQTAPLHGSCVANESNGSDTNPAVTQKSGLSEGISENAQICSSAMNEETDKTVIKSDRSINSQKLSKPQFSQTIQRFVCPVCFSEMKVSDLTEFNQHIDECLIASAQDNGSTSMNVSQDKIKKERHVEVQNEVETNRPECRHPKGTNSGSRNSQDPSNELPLERQCLNPSTSAFNTETDKFKFESRGHVNFKGPILKSEICSPMPDSSRSVKDSKSVALQTSSSDCALSLDVKISTLMCPVCNQIQDTDDLTLFNCHVDVCLNKEVLLQFRDVLPQGHTALQKTSVTVRQSATSTSRKSKRKGSSPPPPSKKTKANGTRQTIDKFFKGN